MYCEIKIELVLSIVAVAVAVIAVFYSNKNSRSQIVVNKLEELFQIVQSLSRYYGRFMELNYKIEELRDSEKTELQTLSQYYAVRDQKITEVERLKISESLARIEVLTMCYTKGELKTLLLEYEKMMYCFSDFVFNGGSIQQELNYKNGFPNYEEFDLLIGKIKNVVISNIKV